MELGANYLHGEYICFKPAFIITAVITPPPTTNGVDEIASSCSFPSS